MPRRPGGLRHIAFCPAQRVGDEPSLRLLQGESVQRIAGVGGERRRRSRQAERPGVDPRVGPEQDQALDHMRELAHVPGPCVPARGVQDLGRKRRRGHAVASRGQPREVPEQRCQIVEPLAQRRNVEGQHLEPEVQIGAKGTGGHHVVQVPVGGGDEPRRDGTRPRAADSAHLPALQHRQQARLKLQRQLSDLVQVHGAVLGCLDEPGAGGVRVGERALLVSEQLRLDQVPGQCRAVEVHERAFGPIAAVVQRAGREVLPRPGLALDEHRRRRAVRVPG